MKYGVVDVGSNSVRLLVSNNGITEYKNSKITALAKNLIDGNLLNDYAIENTISAILFFVSKAKSLGVDKLLCFATAAVRNAKNKSKFISLIKEKFDLDLDVIDGEKEAYLGLLGALNGKNGGIIDIGGASTEIIVSENQEITYKKSLPYGCVNLTNLFGQNKNSIFEFCTNKVLEFKKVPSSMFTGIGGTCLSATSMNLELENYDVNATDGSILSYNDLINLIDKVYSISVFERSNLKGLQEGREEVIGSGLIWLSCIMKFLNVDKIYLSEKDNLEGYLLNYVKENE